jgi:hypothetical protein
MRGGGLCWILQGNDILAAVHLMLDSSRFPVR